MMRAVIFLTAETLEGLGTLIEQGKTYMITYRLRFENNVVAAHHWK